MRMSSVPTYRVAVATQLSGYLKSLRKRAGLTQQALGERLGLSQRMVAKLEAHPDKTSFERVLAVLAALDADLLIQLRETENHRYDTANENGDSATRGVLPDSGPGEDTW